ncbi:hypothetical protein VNI00_017019 [Paramarasmius palmivorus]|uniref:Brain protein I3 n=1 Tax=Paramarasmius palmivorus TaxID=297713 RepID=A0AAW0B976_9AGAR
MSTDNKQNPPSTQPQDLHPPPPVYEAQGQGSQYPPQQSQMSMPTPGGSYHQQQPQQGGPQPPSPSHYPSYQGQGPTMMQPPMQRQPEPKSAAQIGEEYRAGLFAQCAQGIHEPKTQYGPCGIITAVLCFPCGLICLFTDTEQKCARCGVKL